MLGGASVLGWIGVQCAGVGMQCSLPLPLVLVCALHGQAKQLLLTPVHFFVVLLAKVGVSCVMCSS